MTRIYEIAYTSFNSYEAHVKEAFLEYLVFPCDDASQTVLEYKIECSADVSPYLCQNSYDFTVIRIRPQNFIDDFNFQRLAVRQRWYCFEYVLTS